MATQRIADEASSEDFILAQPVSEQRKQQFLERYLMVRERTRTTEQVFGRAGSLQLRPKPAPPGVDDAGFRIAVFKAPFVEGINSVLVSEQHFAMVQEDFLQRRLGRALQDAVAGRDVDVVRCTVPEFLVALDQMADQLQERGREATLFVLAGQIEQQLYDEFKGALQSPYQWYRERDVQKRARHRLMGAHSGLPVINIAESPQPMLYAVDLAQFATLTRYGEGPNYLPEFHVYAFSEAEARAVLARRPRLILDPPPDSGDDEERIRQLRLRVGLELWETYELSVHDPSAVVCCRIGDADD